MNNRGYQPKKDINFDNNNPPKGGSCLSRKPIETGTGDCISSFSYHHRIENRMEEQGIVFVNKNKNNIKISIKDKNSDNMFELELPKKAAELFAIQILTKTREIDNEKQ